MKGDFSRLTFDVTKHFSRVLMQQGRVQLDADWNEQTAILLHYLQALAKDLIGEHGGPADIEDAAKNVLRKNLGFEIIFEKNRIDMILELDNDQKKQLKDMLNNSLSSAVIGKGRYYIDGMLCEIDDYLPLDRQPDYPLPDEKTLAKGNYLVYADVWERHVTYLEDDSIRETALGGPDSAARGRIVWQVKLADKTVDGKDIPKTLTGGVSWRDWASAQWPGWISLWQPANRGMLKAQARQDSANDNDPCIISPESSYRGMENQLYRLEIHQGGKAGDGSVGKKDNGASFKWSRDNGSVATAVKLIGAELTIENPRGQISAGQWLELINDGQELRGEPGTLVKIRKIESDLVSLETDNTPMPTSQLPKDEAWPTKARLWESGQIAVKENDKEWITLADGIQIQFQPSKTTVHQYRTGDYWLIPARVITGDVEWPGEAGKPEALPPHGVEHHYAPLAIIQLDNQKKVLADLRLQLIPLVKNTS